MRPFPSTHHNTFCFYDHFMSLFGSYAHHIRFHLLFAIFFLYVPVAIAATTEPPIDSAALAARVQAEADRALLDLELNAARISQTEREQLFNDIRTDIYTYLIPVKQRFDDAKVLLLNRTGIAESVINFGDQVANFVGLTKGEYLKQQIAQALTDAQVSDALNKMQLQLDEAIERRSADLYSKHRLQFADTLRTLIAQNDLPSIAKEHFLDDILKQIMATNIALAQSRGEPVIESTLDIPIGTLAGGAALAITRTVLRKRLTQQVGARVGASLVARAIGGRAASLLLPGLGWLAFLGGVTYDILNLKSSTVEVVTNAVDTSYRAVENELIAPNAIQPLVDNIISTTEGLLANDLESTRATLVGSFENVLTQARSPGIVAIAGDMPAEAIYRLVKDVALAFGTGYIDLDIRLKRQIVVAGGPERTRILLERYGLQFVELYQRFPQPSSKMLRHDAGLELFDAIMASPNHDAELDIINRALSQYPNFDGTHARTFLLIQDLAPHRSVNEISNEALVAIVPSFHSFDQLRTTRRDIAAALVQAVLEGTVGSITLSTLSNRPIDEVVILAGTMVALGGTQFNTLTVDPGVEWIIKFRSDFPDLSGLKMLREDIGFIHVYAISRRGKEAVKVRSQLINEHGPLDATQDRALAWVLGQLSTRTQVSSSYIDDLISLGIPDGPWPNFLAVPIARVIAYIGLTPAVIMIVLLLVLPPLLAWWRFFGRVGRRRNNGLQLSTPSDMLIHPPGIEVSHKERQ